MKIQPNANSEGNISKEELIDSQGSDSFQGLENFGSFMVSENFDADLRIKECEAKENEDDK